MKRLAVVLFVLAAVFFVAPPIVASLVVDVPTTTYYETDPQTGEVIGEYEVGPTFPGDPESWEAFAAGLYIIGCWLIGLVLAIVGVILIALHSRRSSPVVSSAGPHGEQRNPTRDDVGADVDGRWMCFAHDVVDCPVCQPEVHRRDSERTRQIEHR